MLRTSLIVSAVATLCVLVLGQAAATSQGKPEGYTRVSLMTGLPIHNAQQEVIGKSHDLVVDWKNQQVEYIAIGVGGTVSPDRYVPVKFKEMGLNADGKYFKYDVKKEALASQAAFDHSWMVPSSSKGKDYGEHCCWRSTALIGMPVQNDQGESLGKIHDLVVNLGDGKILYAALSHGGVAGVGDKLFAVPLNSMTLQSPTLQPNKHVFVLSGVSKKTLDDSKGFDEKHWPATADVNMFKVAIR